MKIAASLMVCMTLVGCASGTAIKDTKEASAAIPAGMGRVVVYRTGMMGSAVQPTVAVDGVKKGVCQPNGAFFANVAPGDRVVSAATEVKRETVVRVERGQSAYVRCSIGFGLMVGRPHLEVVPPAKGKSESDKLVLTGKY